MTRMVPMTLSELGRSQLAQTRLLIIDGNEGTRRMLCEVLRSAGMGEICIAANAEEGLEALRHFDPDVVLLDWELPGQSGVDLARLVRKAAMKPDARVRNPRVGMIMLTSRRRERDVVESRNAGIDEFVLRPYSTTALMRAVTAVVLRRRNFVVSPTYIGPDRRRRKALHYGGVLKRDADVELMAESVVADNTRRELSIELLSIKTLMRARGGMHRPTLEHMVRQLINAERKAQDARLALIAQATESLRVYCEMFGDTGDPEVIDVHLEALIALSDMSTKRIEQAKVEGERIVRNLDALIKKRQKPKRLAVASS